MAESYKLKEADLYFWHDLAGILADVDARRSERSNKKQRLGMASFLHDYRCAWLHIRYDIQKSPELRAMLERAFVIAGKRC